MNSPEFKDTVCRICLDESELFDWENILEGHGDVTYKDCYYKYTQIEPLDNDPFSNMLCQNCLQDVQNVHEFILKALDSYNFLWEVNGTKSEIDSSIIIEDIETYVSNEFETVLVEKDDTESVIEDQYEFENSNEEYDYSDEEFLMTMNRSSYASQEENFTPTSINKSTSIESEKEESDGDQSLKADNFNIRRSKRSITSKGTQDNNNISTKSEPRKLQTEQSKDNKRTKNNKKEKKFDSQNTPCMCSICSKIVYNKYALQKHEQTHIENRERKVPCPICGVKFFEQRNVVSHMHIHDEKREKKHKCEFCGKGFYTKGCLNVHRRVHLGQTMSCTLCDKQFFRKIDLEIHMNKHSEIALNGVTKKRSRYLVQCKYCDKKILSTNYKSHTAAHLNQPLAKCLICEKEFFRRESCKEHVKLKHDKKTREEWDPYILSYDNKRLSHLFLEQTAEIIPTHK